MDYHDYLDRAMSLLRACRNLTQYFQIPGASGVLDTALSLAEKVQATKTNAQTIKALGKDILSLSELLETAMRRVQEHLDPNDLEGRRYMERHLQEPASILQRERIAALQQKLKTLNDEAEKLRHGRFLCRCLRSRRDKRVLDDIQAGIRQAIGDFNLGAAITMEAYIDNMWRAIETERNATILRDIPHVESSHQADTQAMKSRYVDETFTGVLEELVAWTKGQFLLKRLCKPVWVISGPPGAGKSTVASRFCHRLQQPDLKALGASFFFDLAVADLSTTRDFFSTIAYQLAQNQSALYPHIVKAAGTHLRSGRNQRMENTAENLLLQPLRALARAHSERMDPIVIVVDGIDECADHAADTIPKMLRLLFACALVPASPIRILLTTRPNPVVDGVLDSPEFRGIVHRHFLHDRPEAATKDIATFLRARLGALELAKQRPTLVNDITSRTTSSFAYAQAVADSILAHPDALEKVMSPGASRPSPSLCALYATVTTRDMHLNALQWRRMRARVERPSVLDLCGTPTCYRSVTDWLRSSHFAGGASPQPLPDDLCSRCQATVEGAPLEAWVLQRIVACLARAGMDVATILPAIPQDGHAQHDPWMPAMRATSSQSGIMRALPEPRPSSEAHIPLPYPRIPVSEPAGGPAPLNSSQGPHVERVPSVGGLQIEEQDSVAAPAMAEAGNVPMPVAQLVERPFVGGFVMQTEAAAIGAVSPPEAASETASPPLPDAPAPLHDPTPIPTPTAPTTPRPRPPRLRITISDPPAHSTPSTRPPSAVRLHAHRTPIEHRAHSPTVFRLIRPTTPRSSLRRGSPRGSPLARRGPAILHSLGTPAQQRMAAPWDDARRRGSGRVTPVSPGRVRRQDPLQWSDLGQELTPVARDSPASPVAVAVPDPVRRDNTA